MELSTFTEKSTEPSHFGKNLKHMEIQELYELCQNCLNDLKKQKSKVSKKSKKNIIATVILALASVGGGAGGGVALTPVAGAIIGGLLMALAYERASRVRSASLDKKELKKLINHYEKLAKLIQEQLLLQPDQLEHDHSSEIHKCLVFSPKIQRKRNQKFEMVSKMMISKKSAEENIFSSPTPFKNP